MFLAFFNNKRCYRVKIDDSVARKKAGGRRRKDSTQENMMMNAAGEEILHTHTQGLLHREAFTQSGSWTQKLLHTEAFTQRSLTQRV